MMTTIIKCDCKSEYQDKTYGNRNRVANIRAGKNNENADVLSVEKNTR